jgi:hypothetical protein
VSEQTYTLDEAVRELDRRACVAQGHEFDVISTGEGEPVKLLCDRCHRSWSVSA